MTSIGDVLSKLKTTIVQTQTKKIDAKLDQAVKDIVSYKSHSGRNGYIDLVRSLVSKTADVKISGSGGGLFSQGVTPVAFGQGARISRYRSYQAIVSQINYCMRALNVLVDNILSPDDITKQALEIKAKELFTDDDSAIASNVRYVKDVIEQLEIERKLDLIIRNTLLFGDLFCELAGPKTALTSQTILAEGIQYQQTINDQYTSGVREKIIHNIGNDKFELNMDYTSLYEAGEKPSKAKQSKKDKQEKRNILINLQLVFHDPQFVLKLQSAMFPICMGYLVFPIQAAMPGTVLADDAINNICVSIMKSLQDKIPQMQDFKDDKELKSIIAALVSNADLNKAMQIRYVPPDVMVHFRVPTTKYYPYGESIFDGTQFSAKVFTSLETALAVQRLSRSTEKRKIAIEIGLPRDARKAIELMKEEFRKRKVSLDSFGSGKRASSEQARLEALPHQLQRGTGAGL